MYRGQSLFIERLEHGVAEVCFDRKDADANMFDVATVEELRDATLLLRNAALAGEIAGVLVTSAKPAFIVGADIFEFRALLAKSPVEIAEFRARQSSVFTEFEDLPVPTLAAINGQALGGGFEFALTADFRVLADDGQVGLPEVSLGLFPGFGGTVRLPRRIGPAVALDWISSGTPHRGPDAIACGAVDALSAPAELRSVALALLRASAGADAWRDARRRRLGSIEAWDAAAADALRTRAATIAARYPAALAAIELVEVCAELGRDEALAREAIAFGQIAHGATAQSLIQLFVNEQTLKRRSRAYAQGASDLANVGVLGAGIMGGGIAYTSASRGIPTVMKDVRSAALELGMSEATRLLERQVKAGRLDAARAAAILERISPTLEFDQFHTINILVEAIVEKLEIKQSVLAEVEQHVPRSTVIVSNTSSLSIDQLAENLSRPEQFAGMHFFNPVPQMPLVEVIRGRYTSDQTVSTVVSFALALGKTPVVLRDCPGFLVNRILNAYYVGFCKLLRDGADFARIDEVMEEFGWPMGPAYLQDVIGMDVSSHVFDLIASGYPARQSINFETPMKRMSNAGRLGQKTASGFYRYVPSEGGRPEKQADPAAYALLDDLQVRGRRQFTADQIVDRMMIPTVLEAATCLEEGITETPAEIDMALVLGVGFPRHRAGVLAYADRVGLQSIVRKCEGYAELGAGYRPSDHFRDLANAGREFYTFSNPWQVATGLALVPSGRAPSGTGTQRSLAK